LKAFLNDTAQWQNETFSRLRHPYSGAQNGEAAHTMVDCGEPKRLPLASGEFRSHFSRYGIVADSRRLERFILWPMGG